MPTTTAQIVRPEPTDTEAFLHLVEQNHLPVDGLRAHLDTALIARVGGRLVATAALEMYADGALLRSVAVAPDLHHQGLGRQLAEAAIQLAGDLGAPAIYLLTTTAEGYFPKFGFERIERSAVPATVRQSVEFTSACPASAVVMRKLL